MLRSLQRIEGIAILALSMVAGHDTKQGDHEQGARSLRQFFGHRRRGPRSNGLGWRVILREEYLWDGDKNKENV